MSVRVTWQPSQDSDIASYLLESAPSIGGPWTQLATIPHSLTGPNWDAVNTVFFYVDAAGTEATYYRLTATDAENQSSAPSSPFRVFTPVASGVPSLVNCISISAGDVAALLALGFTTIEVYETTDDGNSYHEITDSESSPALATSAAALNTFEIGGYTISFSINGGASVSIEFDSLLRLLSPVDVAGVINLTAVGVATVSMGAVVLSSITTGRASSIEVLSSPFSMGFPAGPKYGRDSRIRLVDGVQLYQYYDVAGTKFSRYKWRFSKNGLAPFSNFSQPTVASSVPTTGVTLSMATARFVGLDGKPHRSSIIVAPLSPSSIGGYVVGASEMTSVRADENGFLQVPLVIGARVRIAIEGTSMVRDIVVPNAASFDLMQVLADAPDQFNVQKTIPLVTRRSL